MLIIRTKLYTISDTLEVAKEYYGITGGVVAVIETPDIPVQLYNGMVRQKSVYAWEWNGSALQRLPECHLGKVAELI